MVTIGPGERLPGERLLVGLGSSDRGDDAVGPLAARAVAARGLPGVRVVECVDPITLLDLWCAVDLVVVVDAVRSGAPPGTVHRLHTVAGPRRPARDGDRPSLPAASWPRTGGCGTHAFGLGTAIELGRALRRLPRHLVVVGVEAVGFDHGARLSAPVAAALAGVVDDVVEALSPPSRAGTSPSGQPR